MVTFKKISTYLTLFVLVTLPIFTYGQTTNTLVSGSIPNPLKCETGQNCDSLIFLITSILNGVIIPIAAVFVTIWIIYAGFKYVVAQGNPTKVSEAHKTLLWSLIGAGILLGAAGISAVVQTTINSLIQ